MKKQTKQAFLDAYEQHAEAIYRHCYFRLLSKEKAEELSQETFLRTWQYLEKGKEVDNLKPFLYRVATNLIIDFVRKKKEASLDKMLEDRPHTEPVGLDAGHLEQQIDLSHLHDALALMDQEDRDLITMRYIDDMDPKEIAPILDITPNHVSVKLNRSVKKLTQLMQPDP